MVQIVNIFLSDENVVLGRSAAESKNATDGLGCDKGIFRSNTPKERDTISVRIRIPPSSVFSVRLLIPAGLSGELVFHKWSSKVNFKRKQSFRNKKHWK